MRRPIVLRAIAALAVIGSAASWYGWTRAQSVPEAAPILYSGYLEDAGAPVNGSRGIGLSLWTSTDTATPSNRACEQAPAAIPVTNGWFTVQLTAPCVDAIHRFQALHLQFVVESTAFPLQPIGAVPYAVRAFEYPSGSRLRQILNVGSDGTKVASSGTWWDSLRNEECRMTSVGGTSVCLPETGVVRPTGGSQCDGGLGTRYMDSACTVLPTTASLNGERSTAAPRYVRSQTSSSALALPGGLTKTYCLPTFGGGPCNAEPWDFYPAGTDLPLSDFVTFQEQHE